MGPEVANLVLGLAGLLLASGNLTVFLRVEPNPMFLLMNYDFKYLTDTWTHCCSDVRVTVRHCYVVALVKQVK